jgi:hypothetical protein
MNEAVAMRAETLSVIPPAGHPASVRVAADMTEARRHMVDGQLRPNRINDPRLLAAMGEIARERFLPPSMAARAYVDEDVRLPGGRALIEPMVIAKLVQLLSIRDGDRVLVGSPYEGQDAQGAAYLFDGRMGQHVATWRARPSARLPRARSCWSARMTCAGA